MQNLNTVGTQIVVSFNKHCRENIHRLGYVFLSGFNAKVLQYLTTLTIAHNHSSKSRAAGLCPHSVGFN